VFKWFKAGWIFGSQPNWLVKSTLKNTNFFPSFLSHFLLAHRSLSFNNLISTTTTNDSTKFHTHKICELSVSESCTKRLHMQSLTVFGGVNSRYTSVRCLGNSRLSEALISEKWHDWIWNIYNMNKTFEVKFEKWTGKR
jgi:hypothetical protein